MVSPPAPGNAARPAVPPPRTPISDLAVGGRVLADDCPEGRKCGRAAANVGAGPIDDDVGLAVGHRVEEQRAMGDRLVRGHPKLPAECGHWPNDPGAR